MLKHKVAVAQGEKSYKQQTDSETAFSISNISYWSHQTRLGCSNKTPLCTDLSKGALMLMSLTFNVSEKECFISFFKEVT